MFCPDQHEINEASDAYSKGCDEADLLADEAHALVEDEATMTNFDEQLMRESFGEIKDATKLQTLLNAYLLKDDAAMLAATKKLCEQAYQYQRSHFERVLNGGY